MSLHSRRSTATLLEQQAMGQLLTAGTSSPLRTKSNAHFAPHTLLYAHPSVQYLADEMLKFSSNKLMKGHIRWNQFNDGFPDLFIVCRHNESLSPR